MGQKKKQAFRSMLQTSGYSGKTADDVWNWYTGPTGKGSIPKKGRLHVTKQNFKTEN